MISWLGWVSLPVLVVCITGLVLHHIVMRKRIQLDEALLALTEKLQDTYEDSEYFSEAEMADLIYDVQAEDVDKSNFIEELQQYENKLRVYNEGIEKFPFNVIARFLGLPT